MLALWLTVYIFPATAVHAVGPELPAKATLLMEYSTGEVLSEKNAHDRMPCASITKVMTLLLVFEAIEAGTLRFDDVLTASAHAAGMGGSDIWLREGEQMNVDDLIKACVVMSANDAAVVLAEAVSGTEDAFVARMNERAQELGMQDTVFKNCNGLDEEGHLTSAYDVAVSAFDKFGHLCGEQPAFAHLASVTDNVLYKTLKVVIGGGSNKLRIGLKRLKELLLHLQKQVHKYVYYRIF